MVFAWISDLGFTLHSQFVFASPPPPRLRGEEEDEALPRLVGSAVGDTDARAVAEGVGLEAEALGLVRDDQLPVLEESCAVY